MAVTAAWYGKAGIHLAQGDVAYLTDSVKVALVDNTYVFDADAQETYANIVADEIVAGNGYATRGALLGAKTSEYDPGTNRSRLKASNSVWTPGNGESLSANGAIIYKDSGVDNTSWLLGYVNFGATITAIGAPLTINWDIIDGVLYIQQAG